VATLIINESIWYHSESFYVPYSPNQFLGWDFFAASYSKAALEVKTVDIHALAFYMPIWRRKKPAPVFQQYFPNENFQFLIIVCLYTSSKR
jgi:hypothetical protein